MNTITLQPDPTTFVPATAQPADLGTIDISADRRPSFGRLVRTEVRKMTDTVSSKVLLGLAVGSGLVIATIMVIQSAMSDYVWTLDTLTDATQIGMVLLLPAIVILSVTSEWSQRAAMTTFTLTPDRGRVLGAKFVAVLGATVLSYAVTLGFAAIANLVSGALWDGPTEWTTHAHWTAPLSFVYIAVMAFAFAAMALNSAAALVGYYLTAFAVPGIMLGLSGVRGLADVLPWVDPAAVRGVVFEPSVGSNWAHFAVSATIWVAIPMAMGVRRILRNEIK